MRRMPFQPLITKLLLCVVLMPAMAQAALRIEVSKERENTAQPFAVVPFQNTGAVPVDVAAIIASDLELTGLYQNIPREKMPDISLSDPQIDYKPWRALGLEYMVVGKVEALPSGKFKLQTWLMHLYDTKKPVFNGTGVVSGKKNLRGLAHAMADKIYQKLTGKIGAFDTKIAYVTVKKKPRLRFRLRVSDIDGHNAVIIAQSAQPILSPTWSPDGRYLAYVTYESSQMAIYRYDRVTGTNDMLISQQGVTSAPAWSPDGKTLAIARSEEANTNIYLFNTVTRDIRQFTRSSQVDTEPSWSPDGKHIVFTSRRGGTAQIYRKPVAGGRAERLTFSGKENYCASYSPDGKLLVMVQNRNNKDRIAVMDLATRSSRLVSNGRLDESPSFSPNGELVIYASRDRRWGKLAYATVDGRMNRSIASRGRDVQEPVWSPYLRTK